MTPFAKTLFTLAAGALLGIFGALSFAGDGIIVPNRDEITCSKLTVRGRDGSTVTLGSDNDATYVSVKSNRSTYANIALFIDRNGVPYVQLVDESNRMRSVAVRDLVSLSPRAIGDTTPSTGALK